MTLNEAAASEANTFKFNKMFNKIYGCFPLKGPTRRISKFEIHREIQLKGRVGGSINKQKC